jgi:glycosyltransferase involved in cell wall biosynthesis
VTRALFINSGILGQRTFAQFVRTAFRDERDGVHVTQVLVTEDLTPAERLMRAALCLPLWPRGAGIKNVDFQRFRAELNAGLLARNRIRRLERGGARFDVLHFHRQATAYASLGRMRQVPTIISCDTTQGWMREMASTSLEARTYAPNVRRDGEIFQAARLIVSTSGWAARSIRDEYPECTTDIEVMPNPVPLPPSSTDWVEERHRRAALTPGYRPRVLFVGGDFPRKGGHDLLRVWREERLDARATLDLMTGWPIDPALLTPGVTVHRNVSAHTAEWHALWRRADVFVLPTRDEAWGIAFQEAAAAGLPAIGTRITAVPEIIEHGVTGLLIPPADSPALVRALDTLLSSADRRRAMGARARAFVAESADPEKYRHTLAASIRRLAGHC